MKYLKPVIIQSNKTFAELKRDPQGILPLKAEANSRAADRVIGTRPELVFNDSGKTYKRPQYACAAVIQLQRVAFDNRIYAIIFNNEYGTWDMIYAYSNFPEDDSSDDEPVVTNEDILRTLVGDIASALKEETTVRLSDFEDPNEAAARLVREYGAGWIKGLDDTAKNSPFVQE